jgi:hypothetical protein
MDTFCICEQCRRKVDPADPDVVRAVEVIEVDTMGATYSRVRGLSVFFHRDHYPTGSMDYELAVEM